MKVKLNIRRRMMLIVLSIGLITLVILGGVSFYGMNGMRNHFDGQPANHLSLSLRLDGNES